MSDLPLYTCIIVARDVQTERGPRPVARVVMIPATSPHRAAMMRAALICDSTPSGCELIVVSPVDPADPGAPPVVDVFPLERLQDDTLTALA